MPKGYKTRKTIEKEVTREVVRQIVAAELEEMTKAQIAAAKGIQHFVLRGKDGKFKKVESAEAAVAALNDPDSVYEFWARDPSIQAYTDLVNRLNDKPAEQMRVTGADDGPVEHVFRWRK